MGKTVFVTREVHFNSAHRLHNPAKSDQWNKDTFGLCNSPNYHGHNYRLEVTVKGEVDPETGFVIELGRLKKILEQEIADRCDHKNLNLDVEFLQGMIPSTENLSVVFWDILKDKLPSGELYQIKIFETERNWVEYRGPNA
jgi:6-pyruvoyltetrahydropterin/6-carboxytetrahydropterin synthase